MIQVLPVPPASAALPYAGPVDASGEIREFLTSRRARVTPDQVGLPTYGDHRRVPGLRREEVALLAGLSVDYDTRMERGKLTGVSDTVLDALARALTLDEAERSHLFDLARAAQPTPPARRRRATRQRIRPSMQRILDAMTTSPAFVRNGRLDIVAANQLGYALYSVQVAPGRPANTARFTFLDPRAKDFYLDWDHVADELVALLRLRDDGAPSRSRHDDVRLHRRTPLDVRAEPRPPRELGGHHSRGSGRPAATDVLMVLVT